jgi:hypothetical protein
VRSFSGRYAPFALVEATPDAERLREEERILQALLSHRTLRTDLFRIKLAMAALACRFAD